MQEDKKKQEQYLKIGHFIDYIRHDKQPFQYEILDIQNYRLLIQSLRDENLKEYIDMNSTKIKPYRTFTKPIQAYITYHKVYNHWSPEFIKIKEVLNNMNSVEKIQESFIALEIVQFLKGKLYYFMMSLADDKNAKPQKVPDLYQFVKVFLEFFGKYWNILDLTQLYPNKLYNSPHSALMLSYPEMLYSLAVLLGRPSCIEVPQEKLGDMDRMMKYSLEWLQRTFIPILNEKNLHLLNLQILIRLVAMFIKLFQNFRLLPTEQNLNCIRRLFQQMKYFITKIPYAKFSQAEIQINMMLDTCDKKSQFYFLLKCRKIELYVRFLDLVNQFPSQIEKSNKLIKNIQYILTLTQDQSLKHYVKAYLEHENGLKYYIKNGAFNTVNSAEIVRIVNAKGEEAIKYGVIYRKTEIIKGFVINHKLIKTAIQTYLENCATNEEKQDLILGLNIHKDIPSEYKTNLQKILFNSQQNGHQLTQQQKKIYQLVYKLEQKIISLCGSLFDGTKTRPIEDILKFVPEHFSQKQSSGIFQKEETNLFIQTFIISMLLQKIIGSSKQDLSLLLKKLQDAYKKLVNSMVYIKNKTIFEKRKENLIKILNIFFAKNQANILIQLFCFYIQKVKDLQNKQAKNKAMELIIDFIKKPRFLDNEQDKIFAYRNIMNAINIEAFTHFKFFMELFKFVNEAQGNFKGGQDGYSLIAIFRAPFGIDKLLSVFKNCYTERNIMKKATLFFNKIHLKIICESLRYDIINTLIDVVLEATKELAKKHQPNKHEQEILVELTQLIQSLLISYQDILSKDLMYQRLFLNAHNMNGHSFIKVRVQLENPMRENKKHNSMDQIKKLEGVYVINVSSDLKLFYIKSKAASFFKISPLFSNFIVNDVEIAIEEQFNTIQTISQNFDHKDVFKQGQKMQQVPNSLSEDEDIKVLNLKLRVKDGQNYVRNILMGKLDILFQCCPHTYGIWTKLEIPNQLWSYNQQLKKIKAVFISPSQQLKDNLETSPQQKQRILLRNRIMDQPCQKRIILYALLSNPDMYKYNLDWLYAYFSTIEFRQDIENNLLLILLVEKLKLQLTPTHTTSMLNMLKVDEKTQSQEQLQELNSVEDKYIALIQKILKYIKSNAKFCLFNYMMTLPHTFYASLENCPKLVPYINTFLITNFIDYINSHQPESFPSKMMYYLQRYTHQFEYLIKLLEKDTFNPLHNQNLYLLFENLLQISIQTVISYKNFNLELETNFPTVRALVSLIACLLSKEIKSDLIISEEFKKILSRIIYSKLSAQAITIISSIIQINQREGEQYVRFFHKALEEPEWERRDYIRFNKHNLKHQSGFVGLKNPHSICYINSLLQQLYHTKQFRMSLYETEWKRNGSEQEDLILQLKKIFINLNLRETDSYINNMFFSAFKNDEGGPTAIDIQMDVDEFRSILFDRIQNLIIKPEGEKSNFVQKVFNGKQITLVKSKQCEHQSSREQEFSSICLEVKGLKNLQNSLQNYFKPQVLDGDNMYYCQDCKKKVIAQKINQIKQYPQNLIFVLKRFEFIHQYKKKINESFQFPLHDFKMAQNAHYRLKGIIVHQGISQAGHYFSIIKLKNKWYEFNDNLINELTEEEVVNYSYGEQMPRCNRNAYLVIYQKIEETDYDIENATPFLTQQEFIKSKQVGLTEQIAQIHKFNPLIWKADLLLSPEFENFIRISVMKKIKRCVSLLLKYIITIKLKTISPDINEYKSLLELFEESLCSSVINNQANADLVCQLYRNSSLLAPLKSMFTSIIVKKHGGLDDVMKRFLKSCLLAIHEEVQTAPYFQLFLALAQKDEEILRFLVDARIVGRIYDITITKYLLSYDRNELIASSFQVPFPQIQPTRLDGKKSVEAKQLRYHKWKLVNFIVQSNIRLNPVEMRYLYQWCDRSMRVIFQDASTKACINQISKLFCLICQRNEIFSRAYLKQICRQIGVMDCESPRRYLKAASDLLSIDDSQKVQRAKMIKTAFADAFRMLNDQKIMSSFDIKWQWFMKIAFKYPEFREIVRQSQNQFSIFTSKSQLQALYSTRRSINSEEKEKNKYYGLKISTYSTLTQNNFFQQKFQKNEMIFHAEYQQQIQKINQSQPDYDTDLTDYPDLILKQGEIVYKYDEYNYQFEQVLLENVIGDCLQINQSYFDRGDQKLMPYIMKQEVKEEERI